MTDQSGAFPETLREAPNFAQMCDDFLAQETAVTTEHKNGWGYLDVSDGSPARHYLNAFVGFLSRRFHEYAALERPRPAPPEPQALAALLCETSPSEEGHSWYLTGRPLGPCTAHRSQAARLTGRVFVGSAGTGAAPPDVPKMGALEASLRGLACRCHGDTEGHEASDHLTPSEREVFDQVRRAERPVTTGAAPPKSTLCFHSFPCPSCGEELGQVLAGNYTFTKPHPLRLTDAEFARRRDDMLAGRHNQNRRRAHPLRDPLN